MAKALFIFRQLFATTLGKPKVKKIDAFNGLAKHLIGNTKNEALREVELTGQNMQQRWRTYMCRFKKTLNANHTETGLDITRRELARGMPIPQKLEQMCPYYSRMKVLIDLKPNIAPSATLELANAAPASPISSDVSTIQTATEMSSATHDRVASSDAMSTGDTQQRRSAARTGTAPGGSGNKRERVAPAEKLKCKSSKTEGRKQNKSSTTASDTRMSLSTAYARNAEAKVDYLNKKLVEERRQ
ncbi:hypothetical protein PPTG_00226 [Phytophthora nicotianae INRA-310]|uniref:Myb/SANT-like domain-containing protein n=1 Tax=Phytophthora nicotianae (strain INRA-310) TaxID=761204 RepID=W2RGJ4_PHYN3|nr:hypothetical protein PPTG_00226 [Phytophthora nicotianae INRA-310]ETN23685.1 hypothetical protein PPTG_00226 [Phytophthora nicotianae INRA-310]